MENESEARGGSSIDESSDELPPDLRFTGVDKTMRMSICWVPKGFAEEEGIDGFGIGLGHDSDEAKDNMDDWKAAVKKKNEAVHHEREEDELEDMERFFTFESEMQSGLEGAAMLVKDCQEMEKETEGDLLTVRKDSDNLIVSGVVRHDRHSDLEISTYTFNDASHWVRNDVTLGEIWPITVEFIPSFGKCLVAVSRFNSAVEGIEIYDLNFLNNIEPMKLIGGSENIKKQKKALQHDGQVTSLASQISDSDKLLAGDSNGKVILWDLTVGEFGTAAVKFDLHQTDEHSLKLMEGEEADVTCESVRWSPKKDDVFASVGADGFLAVRSVTSSPKGGQVSWGKLTSGPGGNDALCWSADGKSIYVGEESGIVRVFNLKRMKSSRAEAELGDICVTHVDVTADSDSEVGGDEGVACTVVSLTHIKGVLVTAGHDGFLRCWDLKARTVIQEINTKQAIHCGRQGPDNPSAIAFNHTELVIWDLSCPEASADIQQWIIRNRKKKEETKKK